MKLTKDFLKKIILEELNNADLTRSDDKYSYDTEEEWNDSYYAKQDAMNQAKKGQYGHLAKKSIEDEEKDIDIKNLVFWLYNQYSDFDFKNQNQVLNGFLTKKAIWTIIKESAIHGLDAKEALNQYYLALAELFPKTKSNWRRIFR